MNIVKNSTGWIEIICGSMFSGKTEELIRRLRRAEIAKLKIQSFKPRLDKRYSKDYIVSHDERRINSIPVKDSQDLLGRIEKGTMVIGIDEAQFFDDNLTQVCNQLADSGKRVIVAGLDQDYLGRPFHPIPELLANAEYITKTLAICKQCGNPANKTQRLIKSDKDILLGATDIYEARCRNCFDPQLSKKEE